MSLNMLCFTLHFVSYFVLYNLSFIFLYPLAFGSYREWNRELFENYNKNNNK